MHIKHWQQIFEIKEALIQHQVPQIRYRPEGYWSKYGTLTADVLITGTALTAAAAASATGNTELARGLKSDMFMPIHSNLHKVKIEDDQDGNSK